MRQTCLQTIYEIAKKDKKVIFIGSDLGPGVLDEFKKKFPDRFFMEGVSEQYIIGMAAGMAKRGYRPYVNTIATFLTRRCFDQIIIDLCLHNLPVKLVANGGGLVYAPLGPTHQAFEDIGILRPLPNLTILTPCDAHEMKQLVRLSNMLKGPVYIRIARGGDKVISQKCKIKKIGDPSVFSTGGKICLISMGITAQISQEIVSYYKKRNINFGHIHLNCVKPINEKKLHSYIKNYEKIITIEEHVLIGGLGSLISDFLYKKKLNKKIDLYKYGLPDKFPDKYGEQSDLIVYFELDSKSIIKKINKFL
jgi:transketolase